MDPTQNSPIDFFAVDYPPITSHCCASRITAENPDEGFKPTSGKINSVRFQSSGRPEPSHEQVFVFCMFLFQTCFVFCLSYLSFAFQMCFPSVLPA